MDTEKKGRVKISTGRGHGKNLTSGPRSMEEVRKVILDRIGGIKYLYDKQLKSDPGLRGKIVVEFIIGASGHISSVKIVRSSLKSEALEGKIVRTIKRWAFRKVSEGEFKVVFPFVFAPGK